MHGPLVLLEGDAQKYFNCEHVSEPSHQTTKGAHALRFFLRVTHTQREFIAGVSLLTISQIAARGGFSGFEGDTDVKNPEVEEINGKRQRVLSRSL